MRFKLTQTLAPTVSALSSQVSGCSSTVLLPHSPLRATWLSVTPPTELLQHKRPMRATWQLSCPVLGGLGDLELL